MTEEQRQQYLARRRASYREMIRQGKQVAISTDTTSMPNTGGGARLTTNIGVARLTTIRQMARATTYHQSVTGMEAHGNRTATGTKIYGNGAGPSNRSPGTEIHNNRTGPSNRSSGVHQDTVTTTNSIPQPIASYKPTINNTRSHANINEIRHHVRTSQNCARNFQENTTVLQTTLPPTRTYTHCNARLFHRETFDMCCNGGKVSLPQVNAPQELLDIFLDPSAEGNHFRKHIRGYNHVFSFTSCGVHIDEQLASASHGVYTFRAQGSMYHSIGGFHPDQGARPRFLQLYIYDTDHELQNRMLENTQLHKSLVLKLQQLLHRYKPFIHVFHQLAQRLDVQECSLVIRERPANQPQYSLPTASQVAAIIVGDDIETMVRGRDIKVQTHAGNLRRIQEFIGYYNPLQYPLLFPFGTHGWDINTRTQRGNKVSCRTYYSYMLQIRPNDHSTVLQAGRLLQQYVVDNYVKMETGKLRWVRQRQKELRAELYQGLQDALHTGENNAENVGRRTILPSSFVGSRRDMTQRLVRAEIPCKETEPHLHEAVLRNMVHGPCGTLNQSSPCMKNGQCKRNYPKEFVPETRRGDDSYPQYRKRFDTPIPINQNVTIDNRWVVPYNPWLLLKYDCHINVEICSSIKSIKYLYKYCYKGPDRVAMEVHRSSHYDEVQQFIDARWIAAPEACWRIFRFNLYRMYPSVERLQVHLPNQHQVSFYEHQTISEIVNNDYFSRTMLTEFFALNRADDQQSRHLLYREIPEYYSWHSKEKEWHRRRSQKRAIGRIYTVSPTEGEKFYLRILLSNVRGPTGWDDLLTVDGVQYSSFKQSAQHRGLLESNSSIRSCLVEASILRMPCALRRLFATILIFCEPTDVRSLWDEFLSCMVDDYASTSTTTCNGLTNRLLRDLNDILLQHGKHIAQYDLPALTSDNDNDNFMSRIIQEEMSIEVPQEDLCSIERLNHDQSAAFRCIMNTIDRRESGVFFVDGPGGAGKTFLYRAIIADLRSKGHIVLVTASSEIAATLLPGGRTAHSRFKIPINAEPSSTCNISKQSDLAKLIRQTTAIIWDEVPLTNKETMESLDRTLRDILENNNPFGGKVMVMGGNFCQVLPVVPKGSKSQMISASIVKSHLWAFTKIFHLRQNMRSLNDRDFAEYLMRIGDGIEPTICEDLVQIEVGMAIPWEGEASLHKLIEETFPILQSHGWDASYMVERAILTPKNHDVQQLNDIFINQFPGDERILASFDEVEGDTNNLYQQEYLNSISTGGFPPHMLKETGFQSLWNTWKDEQSIASMRPIDNKVHPIKIYSIGWGGTVKADKTQLWKMFFKIQEVIDKEMYDELQRIFSRKMQVSSDSESYFGLPLKKEEDKHEYP
ncbi:uncharacterized protein [Arachis hypogaea]|uniref:uncharacterized protein n=1 Tax=Arachis hypogaea TaxID=3818 RepID=UPI000DECD441|nr:uncharacterized protein LOC112722005 [Arachis hypogaea]